MNFSSLAYRKALTLTVFLTLLFSFSGSAVFSQDLDSEQDMFSDLVSVQSSGIEGEKETLEEVFNSLPGGASCDMALLTDNPQSFAARWKMMDKAAESIDVTYFIFSDDIFGQAFLGMLIRKAEEGVKVRLMVDKKGNTINKGMTEQYLNALSYAGGKVCMYGTFIKSAVKGVSNTVEAAVSDEESKLHIVACNHDKLLLVDGDLSLTGGRNVSDHYYPAPEDYPKVNIDCDILIKSPTIREELTHVFDIEWNVKWNTHLRKPAHPYTADSTNVILRRADTRQLAAYHIMDYWMKQEPYTEEQIKELKTKGSKFSLQVNKELCAVAKKGMEANGYPGISAFECLQSDQWPMKWRIFPPFVVHSTSSTLMIALPSNQ
jgi:phosphatidylserine/phosphatidylglycerophosphate/cardiolipin synthase-like enzyme